MKTTALEAKPDVAARKQRWRAFLKEGTPPGFLFVVSYPDPAAQQQLKTPLLWPSKKQERIDWILRKYEHDCRRAEEIHDDYVPYLQNLTGTEIFAEAFGCAVHRPTDTNPFAIPFVHTPAEADALAVPELGASTMASLLNIADAVHRRAPEAPMGLVDIQSPMDIAALIWSKEDLFLAMADAPDAVRALAAKVRRFLTAFMDEWFRRYGTEYIAHYPHYFMSGGLTLSEDEIGAVSADCFNEFFAGELAALSAHYGGLGMHCCADARHQWGNLRAIPGLRALNFCKPPTRTAEEYLRPAFDFFGNRLVHIHLGWSPDGDPESWPDRMPDGVRYVLNVGAENHDRAVAICDKLNESPARFRG